MNSAIKKTLTWLEKKGEKNPKMKPKWLYRLEYKDDSCGLWYNGNGEWCFEKGIGSLDDSCTTKSLPMDYDKRYKQDGRDWFSSCSNKEDLLHWYSKKDAKTLLNNGFVFTRYLATEYHEYENETVFIKETSLFREKVDFFDLMEESKPRKQCADYYNEGRDLKMPRLSEFENELANILFDGEYDGSTETEDDIQRGKLEYELAAIKLAPKLLSLIPVDLETGKDYNPTEWNINLAKKGDILSNGTIVLIFDSLGKFEERPVINSWYFADDEKFYGKGTDIYDQWEVDGFRPASEAEKNYLFKTMDEAGYSWDTESNVLEEKSKDKLSSGKPTWDEIRDWFKANYPQNHWKPNGDQLDALYDMLRSFREDSTYKNRDNIAKIVEKFLEQLKTL